MSDPRAAVLAKMEAEEKAGGISSACTRAFMKQYDALVSGETGMMPESSIEPVQGLPGVGDIPPAEPGDALKALMEKTVILKLNGGLGTGMGLDKAKSLLEVKDGKTFLDFIADQIRHTRAELGCPLSFVLMNSFSTEADTRDFMSKGEPLGDWAKINMVQNKVPKLLVDGLAPASHPANPADEWCPPGHGDLYAVLYGSGKLDELIADGKEYVFVSNSDNLGATLHTGLLQWFARDADASFLMEVATRTEADKKGGHLARKGDGLVLRESAQCPSEDEAAFQDTSKHRYFNTNNLWFKLSAVKKAMDANGGVMDLPMIRNEKTVDPKDKKTPKVYQLETAMGAAIASFGAGARAVVVGRDRFAPVKKCDDLLCLRSDAYVVTPDRRLQLAPERQGVPPVVSLGDTYKMVPAFEQLTQMGSAVPSMVKCARLTFKGPLIKLEPGVVFEGEVTVESEGEGKVLKAGVYKDQTVRL
eukprot:TRINITY_DN55514_c0_g1_i1.p1 TRINITY_DN55514_c0_g1~~TRINITY_DN55514_c0_g1_i1.p1  ORF type:complete len:474 (+),score=174.04 TRINITY_DN55514_c0_g1_i1:84-1505(+)